MGEEIPELQPEQPMGEEIPDTLSEQPMGEESASTVLPVDVAMETVAVTEEVGKKKKKKKKKKVLGLQEVTDWAAGPEEALEGSSRQLRARKPAKEDMDTASEGKTKPDLLLVDTSNEPAGILTLNCSVHGFYPKNLNIFWLVPTGMPFQEFSSVSEDIDGTFNKSLSLEIEKSHCMDGQTEITCLLSHTNLTQLLRKKINIADTELCKGGHFNYQIVYGLFIPVILLITVYLSTRIS
ncbi:uncharacterized protein LOC106706506 [Latimeria chalumnae]|uniref:uncharacterized protein LOC106706506 n=1 Tax=Latimeria chalumnae TaxID=7897 RepID=UPI0006D92763|nr:PREDICTED: uncharacterized protein LOC106706506 [Latimeria chalumnae]|eukprot:XP_014353059.1 PREDICTED: uncharacterized protein LOC106706506 [Latimeria chalumnae]